MNYSIYLLFEKGRVCEVKAVAGPTRRRRTPFAVELMGFGLCEAGTHQRAGRGSPDHCYEHLLPPQLPRESAELRVRVPASAGPAPIPPEGGTPTPTGGILCWSPGFSRSDDLAKVFTAVVMRPAPCARPGRARSDQHSGRHGGILSDDSVPPDPAMSRARSIGRGKQE
jgi:hypothetical protein